MKEKHELTENLKILETEIYESRTDLRAINSKIQNSQLYEDELIQRLKLSQEKTNKLKEEFFKKSSEISSKFDKVKGIFDIWTGNFYNE